MKRYICLLLALALAAAASGCGGLGIGEIRKPMDASLFEVLGEESKEFFESFDEASAEYMTVNYDQHFPEATVTDKALMLAMVEALSRIRVTASTNISSTDGYHSVRFFTADGTAHSIDFENSVMCRGEERYILEGAEEFWRLFKDTAAKYSGYDEA